MREEKQSLCFRQTPTSYSYMKYSNKGRTFSVHTVQLFWREKFVPSQVTQVSPPDLPDSFGGSVTSGDLANTMPVV